MLGFRVKVKVRVGVRVRIRGLAAELANALDLRKFPTKIEMCRSVCAHPSLGPKPNQCL